MFLALLRLFSVFIFFAVEYLKTINLRTRWNAGSRGQRQQPHYHFSRESPSERPAHVPMICRSTEEACIEALITDLKTDNSFGWPWKRDVKGTLTHMWQKWNKTVVNLHREEKYIKHFIRRNRKNQSLIYIPRSYLKLSISCAVRSRTC